MQENAIRINPQDNVVVAFRGMQAGEPVVGIVGVDAVANEDIPRNHKIAIKEIPAHSPVIKYGETIGLATQRIRAGDWVHTHNMRTEEKD